MGKYRDRIADKLLERQLEGIGAVVIVGPKWCGKTTTAEQVAKSRIYLDDPENILQYGVMAEISPRRLLLGNTPRLIDEWQIAPKLWDAIRFEVDHREELGQFILTGSAVPPDTSEITHTGTGRFAWLTMRPMSLYESGESSGEVSLLELFEGNDMVDGENGLDIKDIAFLACRGGWPGCVSLRRSAALEQPYNYCEAVINSDINRADGVNKNPERVRRLMRSFARNTGTQAANTLFASDISAGNEASISEETVASYISALKKIFVVEDMPAWNPNIRSKTAIRSSDTRYFVDPSIAAASLQIGPDDLMSDLNTFGFIFESMCVRDLRVYADSLYGKVYHYRDKSGLECDAVIHLRNGSYGLIEIKLGGDSLVEEGAKSLLKLKNQIDTDKMREPSFMMVLTATGAFAYKRPDGVLVVPVGCLRN